MMTSAPTIRACTLADIPSVRTLLLETWHATYDGWIGAAQVEEIGATWHSPHQLAAQVGQPDTYFPVAEVGGALAGTAFAHATGSGVEIGRLYVLPAHQRQGTGSLLLAALVAAFPAEQRFFLDVEPRNASAIAFYRRHGFAIISAATPGAASAAGLSHLTLEKRRSSGLSR